MRGIGFYVGHQNYFAHAKALYHSISEHTKLLANHTVFMAIGSHVATECLESEAYIELKQTKRVIVNIPDKWRRIPFVDKIFAAQAVENICDEGMLWLDVESFILKPFQIMTGGEIYINPVDKKNIGIAKAENLTSLWKEITQYFNLEITPFHYMKTKITREEIYPYFNVGMIWIAKNKNLFNSTKEALLQLLVKDSICDYMERNPLSKIFIHQVVFTVALLKLYEGTIFPLPQYTNYPLHLYNEDPDPPELSNILTIRYDDYFDQYSLPLIWKNKFNGQEEYLKSNWYY